MILLVGGEKGGTGKSTIATNLAVNISKQGKEVIIVDCDPQCTSAKWVERRNKLYGNLPKVFCIQKTGNVYDAVKDLSTRYSNVIIDAGGRDLEELRTAMVACDKIYIPLKASQPDIETAIHMVKLIKLAKGLNPKLLTYIIISMASTNHVLKEDKEAIELLSKLDSIQISNIVIKERKVFRDAIADGKGVIEYNNVKAIEEIKQLTNEIFKMNKSKFSLELESDEEIQSKDDQTNKEALKAFAKGAFSHSTEEIKNEDWKKENPDALPCYNFRLRLNKYQVGLLKHASKIEKRSISNLIKLTLSKSLEKYK